MESWVLESFVGWHQDSRIPGRYFHDLYKDWGGGVLLMAILLLQESGLVSASGAVCLWMEQSAATTTRLD